MFLGLLFSLGGRLLSFGGLRISFGGLSIFSWMATIAKLLDGLLFFREALWNELLWLI